MKNLPFAVLFFSIVVGAQTRGPDTSWKAVDDAMGRPGRINLTDPINSQCPRGDLKVIADESN
jgi:hypothetical protein